MSKQCFQNSWLNNNVVRSIDGIFAILSILCLCNEELYLGFIAIVPSLFVSILLIVFSYKRVQKAIDFYEWDYTERKKKGRFLNNYLVLNGIFTIFFVFWLAFSISELYYKHDLLAFGSDAFVSLFFLFNMIYTISIWYPVFEDDLTLAYKVQKKPDNWQDNGPEINPSDEIEEIRMRDWGF